MPWVYGDSSLTSLKYIRMPTMAAVELGTMRIPCDLR